MKRNRCLQLVCALVLGLLVAMTGFAHSAFAKSKTTATNRFNVIMVVDASWSMKETDPEKLRFEAINQFSTLLAEKGNKLGGVVFRDRIALQKDLAAADSSEEKAIITNALAEVEAGGDTNIGEALSTAMDMLEKSGDKNLPSVILLLSDGNTDLPGATKKERQVSYDKMADAVQRARDEDVRIYSVCLNADKKADIDEMKQISEGTHGQMIEVQNADDLPNAFNEFYKYIFGSSTTTIVDKVFPAGGEIDQPFEVPGLGVEEINIVLYGETTDYTLFKPAKGSEPKGKPAKPIVSSSKTFTLLKVTDIEPGLWKLVTKGKAGDPIKINLLFNTDLGVRMDVMPEKDAYHPNDELTIRAYLNQSGKEATTDEQYTGYKAELQVINALDNKQLQSIPMEVSDAHFELKTKLEKGTYLFSVRTESEYLERISDTTGPYTVSAKATPENTPPKAVVNPLESTVNVWPAWFPFGDKDYRLDLNTLAIDEQDAKLDYAIVDTSFMQGDYTRDNDILIVTHFSISKGEFVIRAADDQGATCDIKVIVNSHDVGLIMLVLAIVGIVIIVGLFAFGLYKALHMFPHGKVSVHSNINGSTSGEDDITWIGRLHLSRCGLDSVGLNYRKSYIQATRERHAVLHTNKPVMYGGRLTKEIRLESGQPVFLDVEDGKRLEIEFKSDVNRNFSEGKGKKPLEHKIHRERKLHKQPRPQRKKAIPKRIPRK